MARDVFQMTLSQPDPTTGVMKALSGVTITVYKRGTTDLATVYQRPTGATQGPTPEAGATGGPNPFATGVSGSAEFWADGPAEYDITVQDTITPARIPPRSGVGAIGWNAFAAAPGSVPTTILATDGNLALGSLGADVMRQVAQIGQVIEWWRPAASVPIPAGWVICDGQQVPAGQHEFAGMTAQAINVPDLRNMFILGAVPSSAAEGASGGNVYKAHAAGAGQGNTPGDAPGIGGTGGSNAAKDFSHGHGVPGIAHLHAGVDHLHGPGSLYAGQHYHTGGNLYVTQHNRVFGPAYGGGESAAFANSISGIGGGNTDYNTAYGFGGTTGAADRPLTTGANDRSLNTATNSTTWTADPGNEMRPRFIGLLRIMKVRRA